MGHRTLWTLAIIAGVIILAVAVSPRYNWVAKFYLKGDQMNIPKKVVNVLKTEERSKNPADSIEVYQDPNGKLNIVSLHSGDEDEDEGEEFLQDNILLFQLLRADDDEILSPTTHIPDCQYYGIWAKRTDRIEMLLLTKIPHLTDDEKKLFDEELDRIGRLPINFQPEVNKVLQSYNFEFEYKQFEL